MFDCTTVVFQHGDNYFLATPKIREHELDVSDPQTLNPQEIPIDHIFPRFESNLTEFINTDRSDVFVKRPRITGYKNSDHLSRLLLEEARICERLLVSPHPNIARYRGCITRDGRITGLCFDKYAETLWQRLNRGVKIGRRCIEQIEAGVQHLHRLGLVHCDIGDQNIMFRELDRDDVVIIDFDSCVKEGGPLPTKGGTMPKGISVAAFSIDLLQIEEVRNLTT